jgi:hypothetical protein
MDRTGIRLLAAGVLGLALLGCATQKPPVEKGPSTDEFRLPPEDDARFSEPPNYPRDVLNQGPTKKNYNSGGPSGMGGPRPGGGSGSAGGPMGGPRGGSLANGGF